MRTLPTGMIRVLAPFAPLFSKRVFEHVQVLLAGAILAPGKRTVSSALRAMGLDQHKTFHRYHRVLSRAVWSSREASRILLELLVEAFVPEGEPLVVGIDETLERRQGKRIAAKGIYRDPVRSSHSHFVKASGLRWLCLMLLAPIPWARRSWALPFCTVLSPSKRYYQDRRRRPNKLTDRARQLLLMVKRWLPQRAIIVVADSSFAALELLGAVRQHMCVITRLRLDAALYDPAPPRLRGAKGRPRSKGTRQPTLQSRLADATTGWHSVTLEQWYSQGKRSVDVATGTAVWHSSGLPTVPMRWVLVRDPQGQFKPQAFLCTDQGMTPAQILSWFVQRWQVEVTFEETRAHLGMETQRQWSAPAIARTTPVILALYSMVALLAKPLFEQGITAIRTAAWYDKQCATFSDTLALVRRYLWRAQTLAMLEKSSDTVEIPRALFHRLADTLSYAA